MSKNRRMATKPTSSRSSRQQDEQVTSNVVKLGNRSYKRVELLPRNTAQEAYVEELLNQRMVFAVGPAGTGKTLLAVLRAIKALREGEISKIVISRPAVSTDEEHGFLPGTLIEKMAPWTRPIMDVFEEYYGLLATNAMVEDGTIEVSPLAYMRGRTFKNAYVILDESQNTTPEQMKMALTRIGEGSSMVITGDLQQHDRGYEKNGLLDFIERYAKNRKGAMSICYFEKKHVERDPLVSEILDIYDEE